VTLDEAKAKLEAIHYRCAVTVDGAAGFYEAVLPLIQELVEESEALLESLNLTGAKRQEAETERDAALDAKRLAESNAEVARLNVATVVAERDAQVNEFHRDTNRLVTLDRQLAVAKARIEQLEEACKQLEAERDIALVKLDTTRVLLARRPHISVEPVASEVIIDYADPQNDLHDRERCEKLGGACAK
jgi:chromosome segregation ATPase